LPRATRAAAAIKRELGVDAELIKGSGGIFQVTVNDRVVAKRESWGFPTEDEIVNAVAEALGR
jgi:selenoprotein W-related protein